MVEFHASYGKRQYRRPRWQLLDDTFETFCRCPSCTVKCGGAGSIIVTPNPETSAIRVDELTTTLAQLLRQHAIVRDFVCMPSRQVFYCYLRACL